MPPCARRAERAAVFGVAVLAAVAARPGAAAAAECTSVQKLSPEQYWTMELVVGMSEERDLGEVRRGHLAGQPGTCFEAPLRRLASVDARTRGYVEGLFSFLRSLPVDPAQWKDSPESLSYLQKASRVTGIAFVPAEATPADVEAGSRAFQKWMHDNRAKLTWSADAGKLIVDPEAGPGREDVEAEEIDATSYWTYEALGALSEVRDGPVERRGRYDLASNDGRFRVPLAGLADREARFAGYRDAVEQLVLGLAGQTGADESLRGPLVARLKQLTGENLDRPEQWLRWWVRNRDSLMLSGDGRRLITESR